MSRRDARPGRTTSAVALVALAAGLGAAVLASLAIGAKPIPLRTVSAALFAFDGSNDHLIVRDLRVPRTVAGLVVGAALGVAGALIQALTRNPLADPGILGVNAGAAFFVAGGITLVGVASIGGYVWFAFAGALVATVAVSLIGSAGRGRPDPVRLTLAGVAFGAVLLGLTNAMVLLDPATFDDMRNWNAGTIDGRPLHVVGPVLPFLLLGLVVALAVARPLNAIALGDDVASSLGTSVTRTRALVVASVTLLAGGATAIAGPIGFVGLMAPHVARRMVGPDQRWIVPSTALLAATLLLVADVIGRVVARPGEVPVGIVTAFVGAPVLIALIRRTRALGL